MKTLSLLLLGGIFAFGQTCQTTDIGPNESFDGAIAESDCTVRDYIRSETSNLKADALRVTLRERLVLRIRMTSTAIDPYLYLLNDRGTVLARNDNATTANKNAEISIQLAAGTYIVVAANVASTFGAYQVVTNTRLAKSCPAQEL